VHPVAVADPATAGALLTAIAAANPAGGVRTCPSISLSSTEDIAEAAIGFSPGESSSARSSRKYRKKYVTICGRGLMNALMRRRVQSQARFAARFLSLTNWQQK
jgi:hypothetical protein